MVRGPVRADESAPVKGKDDVEMLEGDIMNQLIERPLKKCGIDCHDGNRSLCGQSCRKRHPMLLRDPDVVKPGRDFLLEEIESGPVGHGCRHSDKIRILPGKLHDRIAKDLRVGGSGFGFLWRLSRGLVERIDAVEPLDILLGGCVSLSLLRGHVDEDRTVQILHLIEDPDELGHIVAVDRAEIPEPEGFEEHSRRHHHLDAFLDTRGNAPQPVPPHIELVRQLINILLQLVVRRCGDQLREVIREGPDIRSDRHVVIVQNNDQVLLHDPRVVHPLVHHAARHRAIPHHRDDTVFLTRKLTGGNHSEGGGNRSARMSGAERVEFALAPLEKSAQSAQLTDGAHPLFPARQDLMRIGLMADVPDELVVRRIEGIVKRNGEFDGSQSSAQMTTRLGDHFDQIIAHVCTEDFQLRDWQRPYVGRHIDLVQTLIAVVRHSFSSWRVKLPSASLLRRLSVSSAFASLSAHNRDTAMPSSYSFMASSRGTSPSSSFSTINSSRRSESSNVGGTIVSFFFAAMSFRM